MRKSDHDEDQGDYLHENYWVEVHYRGQRHGYKGTDEIWTYSARDLQVGERFADETGEWEMVGRPYATAGGKNVHVRVQRVGQSGATELRTWGLRAHQREARNCRRWTIDDATHFGSGLAGEFPPRLQRRYGASTSLH